MLFHWEGGGTNAAVHYPKVVFPLYPNWEGGGGGVDWGTYLVGVGRGRGSVF